MKNDEGFSDITKHLAVGKAQTHGGPTLAQLKEDHDIGAVVDLNDTKSEAKAAAKIGLKYIGKRMPMVPTPTALKSISKKIDDEVNSGKKVYVHCHQGIYRGPTVAVAYLVYKGLGTDEAVKKVKGQRPTALPGIEDSKRLMPVLRQFENMVHEGKVKGANL